MLSYNETINSDVYIQQLTNLNNSNQEKRLELINRRNIVFHHGNAKPHTLFITRKKLLELRWNVLLHPLCSPELASLDYHLFCFWKTAWMVKILTMMSNRTWFSFFVTNQKFYERRIMLLPERWLKVIDKNWQYITERKYFVQWKICILFS